MSAKIEISVIVPTYNRRYEIFSALDSVFSQTVAVSEIIVVDDASTDDTVDALSKASFPVPVRVIPLARNQGPAVARNAGIMAASGNYVAFLDSDDIWLPYKIERQIRVIQQEDIQPKTVFFSKVNIRRRNESIIRPVRAKRDDEPLADYLFANGGYIDQNSVIIATSLARGMLYCTDLRLHEDWDFYLRMEQCGARFVMCEESLSTTFDYSTDGRASAAKPHMSLAWLERWKESISSKAYLGLRARIAPQLRNQAPIRAFCFIAEAYFQKAISAAYALGLVGRLVHPKLREFAYMGRSWWSGFARWLLKRELPRRS